MKKLATLLAILMLLTMVSPLCVWANEEYESDYEAQVAQIMSSYFSDPEAAKTALANIDTTLLDEPTAVEHYPDSQARGTSPSDYTHYVYSFKRGNSGTYHLQWVLQVHSKEWFAGPLDYISLEWDVNYASYYLSNGDGIASTVQDRNIGIVLFNLEDNVLDVDDYSYGTVRVSP